MDHTTHTRRRFLTTSSLALLAGGMGAWGSSRAAPQLGGTTLRIGTYKGGDSYYFTEAGVEKTPYRSALAEFAAGNLIVEALAAGSLDCGGSATGSISLKLKPFSLRSLSRK